MHRSMEYLVSYYKVSTIFKGLNFFLLKWVQNRQLKWQFMDVQLLRACLSVLAGILTSTIGSLMKSGVVRLEIRNHPSSRIEDKFKNTTTVEHLLEHLVK